MKRTEVLDRLKASKQELSHRYHLKLIGLFGSYATEEQRPDSDIDIIVELSKPLGMEIVDLVIELEKILGRPVDLVTKKALKPELLKAIEQEVVYV